MTLRYMRQSILCTAIVAAAPVLSSCSNMPAAQSDYSSNAPQMQQDRSEARNEVMQAINVVDQMKADGHMRDLMRQAKGIVIVPQYGRAGFIIGGRGGNAVMVARQPNGSWSEPAFYTLGGLSIGLEAGAEGGSIAFVIMSDRALNRFKEANNFALDAGAGLTVINYSANQQVAPGKEDVIAWSNTKGLFGGVSVGVSDVHFDHDRTVAYYNGKSIYPDQIFGGTIAAAAPPSANQLKQVLPS